MCSGSCERGNRIAPASGKIGTRAAACAPSCEQQRRQPAPLRARPRVFEALRLEQLQEALCAPRLRSSRGRGAMISSSASAAASRSPAAMRAWASSKRASWSSGLAASRASSAETSAAGAAATSSAARARAIAGMLGLLRRRAHRAALRASSVLPPAISARARPPITAGIVRRHVADLAEDRFRPAPHRPRPAPARPSRSAARSRPPGPAPRP